MNSKIYIIFSVLLLIIFNSCQGNENVVDPELVTNPSESGTNSTLTITDKSEYNDCSKLILEPDLAEGQFVVSPGEVNTFVIELAVIACDQDYYDLKLEGTLTAKAKLNSSLPVDDDIKYINKNNRITWNIGNLKAGFNKTFRVTIDYKTPSSPYGTFIPLTGGWTIYAKTSDGTPLKVGDNNEIFVQVQ